MNEEALNISLRKFLKVVGVTSQQEIEKAIRAAVADGRLFVSTHLGVIYCFEPAAKDVRPAIVHDPAGTMPRLAPRAAVPVIERNSTFAKGGSPRTRPPSPIPNTRP